MKPKRAMPSKIGSVLVRVTIDAIKHHDQSNLGSNVFICLMLLYYCSSWKEARTGIQIEKEAGGRS